MPVGISYPLINGHYYSPSSVEIAIQSPLVTLPMPAGGFKSLNYSSTITPGQVRGLSSKKVGRTRGTDDYDASMELFLPQWTMLIKTCLGGQGFALVPFNIHITYFEPPTLGVFPLASDPIIHTIVGARITKCTQNGIATGNDALSVSCDLDVMDLSYGPLPFFPLLPIAELGVGI